MNFFEMLILLSDVVMSNLLILSKRVVARFDYFPGKSLISSYLFNLILDVFSMHVSGERLGQLTGIAAILRFPMSDLDLSEDRHHDETNSEFHDADQNDLPSNPNRTVDYFDQTDGERAEASAW